MRRTLLACAVVAVVAAAGAPPGEAGSAQIAAGGTFSVPVLSYKERFFATVVKQQYDYSCGSAAVATLLTYHYDRPTTEAEAFEAMYRAGDQARIHEVGFSLLDIKQFLESRGYPADGFVVPLETVVELGVPGIALIETGGYRHFVVIKGLTDDGVLVGDPARGLKTYRREEFDDLRVNDIVFMIRSNVELARATFNRAEEWRLRSALAPLGVGVDRWGFDGHGALARIPAQPF